MRGEDCFWSLLTAGRRRCETSFAGLTSVVWQTCRCVSCFTVNWERNKDAIARFETGMKGIQGIARLL
ncbi:hypothetical protein ACVW1C_008463 [Bradyrhizobium sp. USDA 4011]|jgi:hypothetical protein